MQTRDAIHRLRSRLRLIAILHAAAECGLTSLPLPALHTVAYFTDALAPVWGIFTIEPHILKHKRAPVNPDVQSEVDALVGQALVLPSDIAHEFIDGKWALLANYRLNPELAEPVIRAMRADREFAHELTVVQEVVLALSGLGVEGLVQAATVDAAYSDPTLDDGEVLSLEMSKTEEVAEQLSAMLSAHGSTARAEVTHLYVRHLYTLMDEAA